MGFLDDMKSEIVRSASQKGNVFALGEGEKATIRFLADAKFVIKLDIHGRFMKEDKAKGYTITCPLTYGHKDCPFHTMDETEENKRNTKSNYCFIVWDYRDATLKAFVYKANGMSPIPAIADHYENLETLLAQRFVVSRNTKKGFEIRYGMTPLNPSDFAELKEAKSQALAILPKIQPNFKDEAYIYQLIKTMYASAFAPFLLKKPLVIPAQFLQEVVDIQDTEEETSTDDLFGSAEINIEDDEFLPGEK